MSDELEARRVLHTGVGIAIGAGAGLVVGALIGGPAIAMGIAVEAGIGVVVGAAWDAQANRPSR
jgi:hypothetical protein